MRKAGEWKKVFCIEGLWNDNLKNKSSVEPVLKLLNQRYALMKYIHKDCATSSELDFYLDKWTKKQYDDHPILYLAFHGEEKSIKVSDKKIDILDDLATVLENKCENRIIIFGSCSTLNIDRRYIKRFLKQTDALAVCGYRTDVDWIKSTAFELLMLDLMQDNEFSGRGIKTIAKNLNNLSKTFKELEFQMVTMSDL